MKTPDDSIKKLILTTESGQLQAVLPPFTGFHFLIVGSQEYYKPCQASIIHNKTVLLNPDQAIIPNNPLIVGERTDMPILSNSVDLVLLPHSWEKNLDPKSILEESWRILASQGYAIILADNNRGWSKKCTTSVSSIRNTMHEIGYQIEYYRVFAYRPWLRNQKLFKALAFLEFLGKYCWPSLGKLYIIVASKQVASLSPIRPSWGNNSVALDGNLIETRTRG